MNSIMAELLSSANARQLWAKRAANALILALCLLPVLSFAQLGQYARPVRDEYIRTGAYAGKPFFEALQQGRTQDYSVGYSYLTARILLDPLGYSVSQIFPAVLLTVQFFCIAALLHQALSALGLEGNRQLVAAGVGGMLLAAACAGLASIQPLYYYEATLKYHLPLAFIVMFMLLLLHVARQPAAKRGQLWLWALLGWALCFAAAGFSETLDIVILLALGLLFALTLLAGGEWRRRCLPILASGGFATVTGILLILSAPGLSNRVARRLLRPNIAERSAEEILIQAAEVWLERIGDPAALASIALMLAVGILVGMTLPQAACNAQSQPRRTTRLPLLLALGSQLLLLPLIWNHQSDQPIILARYSVGYFSVIVINSLLILGSGLLLWQSRRTAIGHKTAAKAAAIGGLAGIFLCFAPTQLRDNMHWRAYLYLWLSAHSLLILLGWHVSRWLRPEQARRFAIGLGCLYFLILAGTAAAAVPTNLFSVKDIPRVYTFLAHIFAWLGLVWGVALGWAFGTVFDSRKWLAAGALLLAVWLSAPIVADNVAMLPHWRQHAAEFDERFAIIIEGHAKGQRNYVFAPFSFDWAKYMGVTSMHWDAFLLLRYDIDSITLAEP